MKENNQATFDKSNTVLVKASPVKLLQSCPPLLPETIANVYDLKTQPELVRYYHAAAGFPTKPTWLAAIKKFTTSHGPDSQNKLQGSISLTPAKYTEDMAEKSRQGLGAPNQQQKRTTTS